MSHLCCALVRCIFLNRKKVVVIEESTVPVRFIDLRIFRREVSRRTFTRGSQLRDDPSPFLIPVLVISGLVRQKRVFDFLYFSYIANFHITNVRVIYVVNAFKKITFHL